MRQGPVALAWLLGLGLAALAVTVGPEHVFASIAGFVAGLSDLLDRLQLMFVPLSFEVVRGLAIGLFATFIVLCLLAARQGRPARAALLAVTVLWLILVSDGDGGRWGMALVLAAVGALVMTRRALG